MVLNVTEGMSSRVDLKLQVIWKFISCATCVIRVSMIDI